MGEIEIPVVDCELRKGINEWGSEDRVSFCAGYQFKLSDDSNIEAALVTGYTSHDVLPMIKFNHKNFLSFLSMRITTGNDLV